MRLSLQRRRLAPALCLLCLCLQTPVKLLSDLLFSGMSVPTGDYLSAMFREALLWLVPALPLLPWRTRRLGSTTDLTPSLWLALPLGVLLQWGAACLRTLLPAAAAGATMPAPQTPAEWLLALLALAVMPALCEEAFFRGGVLSCLRDVTSPIAAFMLCTLLFALMHGSLSGLPAHLLVSAACTLLMLNTGMMLPAMLLHLGYNVTALLIAWLPVSPCLALVLLIPAASLVLLAARMRWQSSEKHLSRIDAILIGLVLAGCAVRYLPI